MTWAWIWIASLLLYIASEAIIKRTLSPFLLPATVVATILDIFEIDILWQLTAFTVLTAVSFVFLRKYSFPLPVAHVKSPDIDTVVGERCTVTERIDTYAGCGQVNVKGTFWSARGLNDSDVFEVGEQLLVVAVEGVKLICKR